jgi:hypothetical protein
MGGQTGGVLSRVSFLLFPRPLNVVGGCGWVEHKPEISFADCGVKGKFGMLLGPEKTPAWWWVVFSGWPFPAWTV